MKRGSSASRPWADFGRQCGVCLGLLALGETGFAQAQSVEPVSVSTNVVHIAATGFLEVEQDWLTLHMSVTREGTDAAQVQSQLRTALDSAMEVAKGAAIERQLAVRSGRFGVFARYDKTGKVSGWQGQAELVLEGRDFTRIAHTASRMQPLTVSNMAFSLSRESQQQLESDVQTLAIERFQRRAGEVTKAFGMSGHELKEVSISSADAGEEGRFRHQAMTMDAASSLQKVEPLPVEPGRSRLTVTVSGSIRLK